MGCRFGGSRMGAVLQFDFAFQLLADLVLASASPLF